VTHYELLPIRVQAWKLGWENWKELTDRVHGRFHQGTNGTYLDKTKPDHRKSGDGAKGYLQVSNLFDPGRAGFCWYGINGTSGRDTWMPSRRWPADGTTPATAPVTTKMSEIRKSAETVFLFDGVSFNLHGRPNRLNARHNKQTITNILFFDGHAESLRTKDLPGGDGNANQSTAGETFRPGGPELAKKPYPVWRLDQ
jgi:prepilin-type processing-associated H-X9-DG protein